MPLHNDIEVEAGSEGHVSDFACIQTPEPIFPLRRVQFRSPRAYVPRGFKMLPEKDRCKQSQSSESIMHRSGPAGSPSNTWSKGKRNGDTYYSSYNAGQSHGFSRQTATTERRSSFLRGTETRSKMFPIRKIHLNGLSTGKAKTQTDTLHGNRSPPDLSSNYTR
ncbi:hypothetical protein DPMN_059014 [Dreissena polymorpha]|uniref:Uncharacterized protein n=1 Tax=Dreissena polymorpha TaxID=45954 RepID=A0A9D4C371_DREPO|nr:hypothetical protein DPMN_059014 [Dreissena polymorpha]